MIIPDSNKFKNSRHVIIGGVNKAGTSSIFTYLAEHPEICASDKKETRFFLSSSSENPEADYNKYLNHFNDGTPDSSKLLLEATPDYLRFGRTVAERIHRLLGKVQLIFVLREPADRLYSHFRSHSTKSLNRLPNDLSFEKYVELCREFEKNGENPMKLKKLHLDALRSGHYASYLNEFAEVLGGWDDILIVFFEDLRRDPERFMKTICDHVGITASFYDHYRFRHFNVSITPRNQAFHRLAALANYRLEPYIRRYPLLKQQLTSWYGRLNAQKRTHGSIPLLARVVLVPHEVGIISFPSPDR